MRHNRLVCSSCIYWTHHVPSSFKRWIHLGLQQGRSGTFESNPSEIELIALASE